MKTSDSGVAFIAACEGVVTHAYRDVAGVWTIGVGHTAAAGAPRPASGMTITRDEAFAILARDLARCEARVARRLPNASQTAFDGAVSFDFNTGAIDRASWVPAFLAGDRRLARTRLMLWVKAGGHTLAGLVKRRAAEARLIFDGDYGGSVAPQSSATIKRLQSDLRHLGFYKARVDGIAGAETRAAVIAYQRRHPDLAVDGAAGPATLASIARDIAVRRGAGGGAGAAATAGIAAVAAMGFSNHALLVALLIGSAVLAIALGILAHRYGGELARMIGTGRKP